jgi:hypothetical protein
VESPGSYPSITLPDQRIELTLGDLVSEETRALVLLAELLPIPFIGNRPAASLEGEKLLELEVLWDDIGEKEIKSCRHAQVVRISATQDPAEIKLNEETVAWIAVQRAGKALDEATKAVDADRVEEAKDKLRKALEALRRYKLDSKTADGVKLLQEFLKRIEREGGLTARSRKLSTYSSAYYSKPSSRRAWTSDAATTPEFSEKKSVEEQMKETEDDVEPPVSPS